MGCLTPLEQCGASSGTGATYDQGVTLLPLTNAAAARPSDARGTCSKQASTFAGEQNVADNIGALSRKLSRGCLKPLDEPQACSAVCASEDACNFCASARHLMQAGAARKQACTFAGEQNVAGNIGALSRKLSQGLTEMISALNGGRKLKAEN